MKHPVTRDSVRTRARLPRGWPGAVPSGTAPSGPSWSMQFVARLLSAEHKLMSDADGFALAYQGKPEPKPAPIPLALRLVADVTTRTVLGRTVYTLVPRRPAEQSADPADPTPGPPAVEPSPWHIVYLHGGGFVNSIIGPHWDIVLQLIRHTGATITVPLYPLAPLHTHRDGQPFVEAVYRELAATVPPSRIVLAGDSAGGTIAIVTAMHLRDAGEAGPARLVLFSPCTSVVAGSDEVEDIEPLDPILARPGGMLAGTWWAGDDDPAIPEVSPLFGDVRGLPPIQIFQGTRDILLPDVRRFAERVRDVGGEVDLRIYHGAIHVFVGATFTPEAQDAFRRIEAALEAQAPAYAGFRRIATSHVGMLPRQAVARARADGTPWIRHGRRAAEAFSAWQRTAQGRHKVLGGRWPVRLA